MRHFESGAARRAAAIAGIPIINAGDGPGQHPTQVCQMLFLVMILNFFIFLIVCKFLRTVYKQIVLGEKKNQMRK